MHIGINIYILNTFSKGGGGRILGEPLVGMMLEEGLVRIFSTLIKEYRIANCKINLVKTDCHRKLTISVLRPSLLSDSSQFTSNCQVTA